MTTVKTINMTTRPVSDPIMWTHALLWANSYLYMSHGYVYLSIAIFFNVMFSWMYHRYTEDENIWCELDRVSCLISLGLIAWYICSLCSLLQIGLCVTWLGISLIILELGHTINYRIFHSLWHFMVFGGNVVVFSYLPPL